MAWIEVHQSLPTHRKTLALCDALNIAPAQAVGHLTCLWLWALDSAPHGALLDVSSKTIARAAQWTKAPEAFVSALVQVGFLDQDHAIHDWPEYTWRLLDGRDENRSRNRERQQRWRDKQTDRNALRVTENNVMDNAAEREHNVTRNAAECDNNRATVPNPTVPYPTQPLDVADAAVASSSPVGDFKFLGDVLRRPMPTVMSEATFERLRRQRKEKANDAIG